MFGDFYYGWLSVAQWLIGLWFFLTFHDLNCFLAFILIQDIGEPQYLIREPMRKKYPAIPVPNKVPMPRPVDEYFKDWKGPKRPEFKKNLDMSKFTGNQKWQMYCLEEFLNMNEL